MGENIGEKTIRYYWKKMTQLKFDLTYYGLHFKSCVYWLRFIGIGSAVLSALATGAWLEWHETKWIPDKRLFRDEVRE